MRSWLSRPEGGEHEEVVYLRQRRRHERERPPVGLAIDSSGGEGRPLRASRFALALDRLKASVRKLLHQGRIRILRGRDPLCRRQTASSLPCQLLPLESSQRTVRVRAGPEPDYPQAGCILPRLHDPASRRGRDSLVPRLPPRAHQP
jgi:hypothetical protein